MIRIVREKILKEQLQEFLGQPYDSMIKFVADIRQEVMALGGQLHADGEALLLQEGSSQMDLWGGNFYPGRAAGQRIEFTSMINIRPSAKNFAIEVKDEGIREKIKEIVMKLLPC